MMNMPRHERRELGTELATGYEPGHEDGHVAKRVTRPIRNREAPAPLPLLGWQPWEPSPIGKEARHERARELDPPRRP